MNRSVRTMLIMTAALIAAAAIACAKPGKEPQAIPAPDFSLQDIRGNALSLADFKGKVLVLNFWATWCPPCRREIPDLIAAYDELKGEGLEIVGVSVDELPAASLLDWVKKMGITYPVALATEKIVADYEPGDYIPATIIVDRKGLIRYRQSALMTKDTLVRLFNRFK